MRMLTVLDGTPECEVALPFVAKLASAVDADIYLLAVLSAFAPTKGHVHQEPGQPEGTEPKILGTMKRAKGYLDEVVVRYNLPANRTERLVGRDKDPCKEIVTLASSNEVDFIVMSFYCRDKLQPLMQGGYCDDVLDLGAFPILYVPEPPEEDIQRQPSR